MDCFRALKELCKIKGFASRGKAFFRVQGDGVLQVLKYEKVRYHSVHEISIGLFSLYDELKPAWFTASGCIPRYRTIIFQGKRSAAYLEKIGNVCYWRTVSFESQLEALKKQVIPFLDGIQSQAQLAEGICQLDKLEACGTIRWNDDLKFVPWLYAKDYESARRVMQAILDQHRSVLESKKRYLSPDEFQIFYEQRQSEDIQLWKKLEMAELEDTELIQKYFLENYQKNCELARFAMRKVGN